MAPIRVGFIGLSKSGWAKNAHFPYLEKSDKYLIVAICNSTVESAKEAIVRYGLSEETRAYGDPEDLARDPNIDLVVCSVRVDRHLSTVSPSLKTGKNVLVEWPLGKNLAEAQELLRLKNEGNVKLAVVDLQAREAPIIAAIKGVIESGKIGHVLSSNVSAYAGQGGSTTTEGMEYLGRREVGGNLLTIHFGHAIDYIQHVLGYGFQTPGPKTLLSNRRKTVQLLDANGHILEPNHPKPADDTIYLHGLLSSSSSSSIPLSFTLRGGSPFPGTPGLDWRIYGQRGEIRITASGPFLQIGTEDMRVEVEIDGKVENVAFSEGIREEARAFDFGALAMPGRNVGRVYEALSQGRVVCGFEDAVERHAVLEGMYRENGIVVDY